MILKFVCLGISVFCFVVRFLGSNEYDFGIFLGVRFDRKEVF